VRYLAVLNQDSGAGVKGTLGIKGLYGRVRDLGVCGSVSFRPKTERTNTYIELTLDPGEGTVLKLEDAAEFRADLELEALRTEVARLAGISGHAAGDVGALDREALAIEYNRLLGRTPVAHFEPVKPGEVVVSAPFTDDLVLAVSDGERPHLARPDRAFGKARIDNGSLMLDEAGSGICYRGEGFAGEPWGGSLGTIVGKPFTVEMEFRASGGDSAGTLMDIWYGFTGHFRIRLLDGGRLQVFQRKGWWYVPAQRELTTKPCGVGDGRWHRIAVTVPNAGDEDRGVAIYVDGKLVCRENDPDTHGSYTLIHDNPNIPGGNPGLPVVDGWICCWSVGCHLDRITHSVSVTTNPKDLDTATGRYRNVIVREGADGPAAQAVGDGG